MRAPTTRVASLYMSIRIVGTCLSVFALGMLCACGGGSDSPAAPAPPTVPQTFSIGGTVTGLLPGASLRLLGAGDSLTIAANGSFQFTRQLVAGSRYNVVVDSTPADHYCTVGAGSGTVEAAVANVRVTCASLSILWSFPIDSNDQTSGSFSGVMRGADGALYGTTSNGGTGNWGTIFRIGSGGTGTVWDLGATSNNGWQPHSGLIQASDGNFYGTTFYGGTHGMGTVVRLTPAGAQTVLWNFGADDDGWNPVARLVEGTDGNLYGTTAGGGRNSKGAVFRLTKAGVESVLWHFGTTTNDGKQPWSGVIQATDGYLYGTTTEGGMYGSGALFRLSLAGELTLLSQFDSGGPGSFGRLMQASDGSIYGMGNRGMWYRVTAAGIENVVGSPAPVRALNQGDQAELIQGRDGNFYGTSYRGVYRLTPAGDVTILWDVIGQYMQTSSVLMQDADGSLYGTTFAYNSSLLTTPGVVFRIVF